jgi:hypothetical protein
MVALGLVASAITSSALSLPLPQHARPKSQDDPYFSAQALCDLHCDTLSGDAIEVANVLHLTPLFRQLEDLRKQVEVFKGEKVPSELREQLRDVKEDIRETIEQARLEVDFVQAELSVELAGQSELLRAYSEARDNRVNFANIWGFRTNGALWALAEALDIPTYKRPRYSIPSGTIGILAGIVPSAFSILAVRESSGGHYDRAPRPNMLSKIFDYPCVPRIDYPDDVLAFLRTVPAKSRPGYSRIDQLVDRWIADKNIHIFSDRNSTKQLDVITGTVQNRLTIQSISDRLTMLQQLSAIINQMNRPLLELMMAVRGTKHFPINN